MNALEVAKKMETDAIIFYAAAAEKVTHAAGKKMFLSIREDEKRHLEMVAQLIKGMNFTVNDVSPMKNVRTAFDSLKQEMMQRIKVSDDELEAFEIAMKMEKEGEAFYQKSLAGAKTEKEKALFSRLIEEEQQHYALFSNTHSYLADTGNWFLWDERGIVEG